MSKHEKDKQFNPFRNSKIKRRKLKHKRGKIIEITPNYKMRTLDNKHENLKDIIHYSPQFYSFCNWLSQEEKEEKIDDKDVLVQIPKELTSEQMAILMPLTIDTTYPNESYINSNKMNDKEEYLSDHVNSLSLNEGNINITITGQILPEVTYVYNSIKSGELVIIPFSQNGPMHIINNIIDNILKRQKIRSEELVSGEWPSENIKVNKAAATDERNMKYRNIMTQILTYFEKICQNAIIDKNQNKIVLWLRIAKHIDIDNKCLIICTGGSSTKESNKVMDNVIKGIVQLKDE